MNRTTTLTNVALKSGNLATPHIPVVNASAKAVEHDDIGVGGPSGSVYSSANDAIRYLQTLLRRGETPAGKRVLESSFVEDSIKPRMVVGAVAGGQKADNDKDFSITTYALGWDVENFRGSRLVSHSGGVVGFSTFFAWLPEYGVAVAASTNCEVDFTSEAAVLDLLDIFFGEDNRGKDWLSIFDSRFKPPPPQLPKPVPNTKPSHASLDEYTGVYAHPAFGSISITLGKASGVLVFEAFDKRISSELKHYHYDTFSCRISILPSIPFDLPITFRTDALTGKINQASIPLDPLAPEITFTRTK
ncbi:beta-lactamase/transpeptidase-like protein [Ramicandelaber brevisporus]|nr:beta-lactamase/transpeptidase-like protein [Ramicandelaber brevisporus]